jgi:hypothetical protein
VFLYVNRGEQQQQLSHGYYFVCIDSSIETKRRGKRRGPISPRPFTAHLVVLAYMYLVATFYDLLLF